ncbi:VHS domain protein [Aulographum hederae CBS 113979]|uniref:VHS domain protein n=1 Tax=Aulographum hederae CBS 113979 TaxID=1176131 RepID=A0A6G1GJ40_9PEZI|nr:VHS domain protein [Aulographum hederae CBS 113979]
MAARDRFGGFGEPASTPLQRFILNACDPQNFEPNLALNLEISDMINAKKGNAPREAAVAIVNYVNHRNPNVSLLALNLLDICVKNCGYPFHLQISTKDFLNELVRRFPERPPVHASRVQGRILELIEEWRSTICQTSRYKEDLGFIRDMHRLLSYKGYVFPEVRREDAAVLNPSDNLRSAEEMEEEEKAAQSAKLQELIRRGGPHDLQEANKLMKVMAGYDTRNKTDYRAKAAEEVGRIQQKAKLLEDMLQRHQQGDVIKEGDVYEELANALMSAQPKIQKMCEEESDDHEAVAKLFEINDSIHRTIERYKLIKKGDIEGASKIPKGTLGTSGAGVTKGPDNELSLIDLGGPEESEQSSASAGASAPAPKGNALEDDLLGLSMGDSFGQGGGISLGPSNGFAAMPPPASSPPPNNTAQSVPGIFQQPNALQPSQQPPTAPKPNYNPFGTLGSAPSVMQPASPQPSSMFTSMTQQSSQASKRSSAVDPFASLAPASHTPRQNSPFQFQQSVKPSTPNPLSSSLLDIGGSSAPPQPSPSNPLNAYHNQVPPHSAASTEDEWTFASSLPDQAHDLTVVKSNIVVNWHVSRPDANSDNILILSKISNNTAQPVTELTFQVAVTKSYTLKLEPQTGRSLAPQQLDGIMQTIRLVGVERGKGPAVKMRWKASYMVAAERKEEMGEITALGVS